MLFALTHEWGASTDAIEELLAKAATQAADYLQRRAGQ